MNVIRLAFDRANEVPGGVAVCTDWRIRLGIVGAGHPHLMQQRLHCGWEQVARTQLLH